MDSQDLLLLGVGILIGLGFVTVMLLIQRQAPSAPLYVTAPSYVQVPASLRRE